MTAGVAIAISAFRSDASVIALLERIIAEPPREPATIIVVDSLGSGAIAEAIRTRGWPVRYANFERNLGSAGNLAMRHKIASEVGANWVLCLNHDASWSAGRLSAMLATAHSQPRVGAVYPVIHQGQRPRPWEDGRRSFRPSSGVRSDTRPAGDVGNDVLWSSSNGALYATAPAREGIAVMAELWMGYEDLAYGIALHQGGWVQLMCRDAVLGDIFDFQSRRILGREFVIPDKPAWYSYYNIRNLILIRRRYGSQGVTYLDAAQKLLQSSARILLLETQKLARLGFLLSGTLAGIAGKRGKGPRP